MIEQNVQVVRCQGDSLWVRLGSRSGCRACDDGKGCGAGLFAKLFQKKPVVLELPRNDLSVTTGQMMTLAFPERLYVRLVLASYGWPLLAALAGALTGHGVAEWYRLAPWLIDLVTLIAGLLAAVISMKLIRGRQHTGLFHDCLQSMDYYPATGTGACDRDSTVPGNDAN